MLNQGKDELEELKKSAEKGDIYALAITAMCLMFQDVKAAELSDLVGGEKKIGECLQNVQNPALKELIKNMSLSDYRQRFSIQQCLEFFQQNLIQIIKKDLIPDSLNPKNNNLIPQPQKPNQTQNLQ